MERVMPLRPFLPRIGLAVAGITAAIARKTWRAVVIAAVVCLHTQLHWSAISQRSPVVYLGNYPHSYSRSLSLAAGLGYQRLPLAADSASLPLKRFLDMQQESLSV